MARTAPIALTLPRHRRHRPCVCRLVALALGLLLSGAAAPAHADTSGALVLRGFVPTRCDIEVGAAPRASALPLTAPQRDVVVASVRETCNSATGYTVEVSSRHEGRLAGVDGRDAIAYQLQYGDAAPSLSGSRTEPVKLVQSASRTAREGVERIVRISHEGANATSGGSYEDTLTFTIRAK